MRRISYIITSLIMVFSMATITAFAKPDWPIDTGIQSEAGIVMDMDSGAVLFAQNIHEQKIPASITKLLTALVVIENTNDLDAPVTFSHDAIYNVESGAGNKFNLEEGDVLSVRQCLYAMLLQSSNQSANALAEYVAGSRQAFVDMMNQRIEELGCNESHFANPSGLNDDTQRTTAYDMAIIARACFQNPTGWRLPQPGLLPYRPLPTIPMGGHFPSSTRCCCQTIPTIIPTPLQVRPAGHPRPDRPLSPTPDGRAEARLQSLLRVPRKPTIRIQRPFWISALQNSRM